MTAGKSAAALPRQINLATTALTLRRMTAADGDAMLAFAQALPPHDLIFLGRDITRPEVVAQWIADLEGGVTTLLALEFDRIRG